MFLKEKDFVDLVKNAPVVAIDLCINKKNKILLGKRINPPAKNYYFVPGGRIRKNETIEKTIIRLLKEELQLEFIENNIKKLLIGVFQHFYEDNFIGNNDFNSHYVTISYLINFDDLKKLKSFENKEQHSMYIWYEKNNLKYKEIIIHKYSRDYLESDIIQKLLTKD